MTWDELIKLSDLLHKLHKETFEKEGNTLEKGLISMACAWVHGLIDAKWDEKRGD